MGPLTYERHLEAKISLEILKFKRIPVGKDWNPVVRYHSMSLPP